MSSDEEESCLLRPGRIIRPQITLEMAKDLVHNLYGLEVISCTELISYDDKNFHVIVSDRFDNLNIDKIWKHGYVLKILNSLDSSKEHLIDGQNSMMQFLGSKNFTCPQPVPTKDGHLKVLEKVAVGKNCSDWAENNDGIQTSSGHIVRLLTFIPGKVLNTVPVTEDLLYHGGKYTALLNNALKEFSHSGFDGEEDKKIWCLKNLPSLTKFLYVIKDQKRLEILHSVIKEFVDCVLPNYDKLPKGLTHGDLNEQNLLVREVSSSCVNNSMYRIEALLDFADSVCMPYIFEVSIFIAYMMIENKTIESSLIGGYVLAGYQTISPLTNLELALIRICIASRITQSLVMGSYSYSLDPGNEYLLHTSKTGWQVLESFWSISSDDLINKWESIIKNYINST